MSVIKSNGAGSAAKKFYNDVATQSLRFDDSSGAYLSRTPSSASNRRTFTFSAWIKRGVLDGENTTGSSDTSIFSAGTGGTISVFRFNSQLITDANDLQLYTYVSGGVDYSEEAGIKLRDVSSWYHVVFSVDTTQSTASNRVRYYLNGTELTNKGQYYAQVPQNYDTHINNNVAHGIGRNVTETRYFDGYMAEINFVDGTQYDASYFGETKNGIWIAKEPNVTYGTEGYRLQFKQTGTGTASSSTIGADTSGNNNHWTTNNLSAHDCVPDSPENNFATMNGEFRVYGGDQLQTFSEGNLKIGKPATHDAHTQGTMSVTPILLDGKGVYFEARVGAGVSNNTYFGIMAGHESNTASSASIAPYSFPYILAHDVLRGYIYTNSGSSSSNDYRSIVTYAENDIIGIAIKSNGKVFVHKNGTYFNNVNGSAQNVSTEANPIYTLDTTKDFFPYTGGESAGHFNFGQDSTFSGAISAGGNSDGNSIGDFAYAVPSGCLALCSANLPDTTIGPNSGTQADDYFNTVTYTGNATARSITGVGFQPDWLWFKNRSLADNHTMYDSSRGVTKVLKPNLTNAESTVAQTVTAFGTDGFSVGDDAEINHNTSNFVTWNWKANGGTTSSNSDGSITSTVQANTDAGFSIVTYTGNNTTGATVGHGLGAVPHWYFIKRRSNTGDWITYHHNLASDPQTDLLKLNTDGALIDADSVWNDTAPTSSVFSLGTSVDLNANGQTYVAIVFTGIKGYSKFGVYTGNGSADGTFVFTGFRPAWVMVKRVDADQTWRIFDNKRNPFNDVDLNLVANLQGAEFESSAYNALDFLSNGFRLVGTNADAGSNASGGTYVYHAFAEAPFKYANAR